MNLNVNQVMKIVIDNSIIPDMTKELEFYKLAYDNAQYLLRKEWYRLGSHPCTKCFKYDYFCYECNEKYCTYCDNVCVRQCNKCMNMLCDKHKFIEESCEECYNEDN